MKLVLVVELVDQSTSVYSTWDDLIKDLKRSHPRLRFGSMNIAMPEWTAQALLSRNRDSLGLMEDGEVLGKVTVQELATT